MRKAEFIKNVWVFVCNFCKQYSRFLNLLPNLLDNATRRKQFIGANRLEAGILDRRDVYLLVISVIPGAKRHHNETGIEELANARLLGYASGACNTFRCGGSCFNFGDRRPRLGFSVHVERPEELKVG